MLFKMNSVLVLSSIFLIVQVAAPPPRRNDVEKNEVKSNEEDKGELEDFGLEYNRYLKEVVELLESDPQFKKKLEDAQETDIRSGKIAEELEYVDHKVRTKLDEVKRQEIERLRHLAQKQFEITNGIDTEHVKVSSEHLDHDNPHTFEMEDLKKLIAKVSSDLSEADEKRRQEFKEYEMQKEFEKQERLKHLEGAEKEAFEKQMQENETKHKQHEPLHHPGSKQQLEEVWEKQDHMENQQWNPKVFFQLHDLDGNGVWDHNEVNALFLKELDKMYQHGAPEDDPRERVEEMERMREHVFSEADKNKDGLISYQEFLAKTKEPDFEKDPGWESLDQKPIYTHEEYQEFERRRQEEVQKMIAQGLIPPQPVYQPYAGYHYPQGYGHPQEQYHPQQFGQGHPQQVPQGYHPNQGYGQHPNQMPQGHQQGHPNQIPQGHHQGYQQEHFKQEYPQQVQGHPPMLGHPNQMQQGHPNQVPQVHPNQMPQAHPNQVHPNQIPQGHPNQVPQVHPNQIPQGHPNQFQQGNLNQNQVPQGQANQYPSQGHVNQANQPQQVQSNEVHQNSPNFRPADNVNAHPNDINSQHGDSGNLKSQQAQAGKH